MGYFAEFLGSEQQDIGTITGNDLRRFIIALQDKPKFANHPYNKTQQAKLSAQSIETYCRGIKAFFSFLKREGFTENNIIAKVKMPKVPEVVIPTFSEKEVAKLLSQTNKGTNEGFRDYCLLLTLIDTGIRLSELANLKTDDIDYEQNQFRVMGKGLRERFVPFGRRVAKALMKYQLKCRPEAIGTDNFWLRRDGQPLLPKRIEKLVSAYGKKAGLKRCYAHKLRHTSSVMYLRNGGDVFSLQKKLDVDYDNYLILGACNPPLAYQALQAEKDIGLLLPCNVIAYEDEGVTFVSAILPTMAMSMVESEKLRSIAVQVEHKLKKVIDSI